MPEAEQKFGKSIGYAVELLMDYGNGRQVRISGTLPLDATQKEFDAELDKLRLATNRQQSFVILRDREARLASERKMVAAIQHMIDTYQTGVDEEMAKIAASPIKNHTTVKQQAESLRQQALNYAQMKTEELMRHQAEVEVCEVIIAGVKKEIEG